MGRRGAASEPVRGLPAAAADSPRQRGSHREAVLAATGNRALARLAGTQRGRHALAAGRSVRGPLLQRVGEEKIGYAPAKDAPAPSLDLLKAAFAEMRSNRKAAKDQFERDELSKLSGLTEKQRQKVVMDKYVSSLTIKNPSAVLAQSSQFTSGKLKLVDGTVKDADDNVVATITRGAGVFEEVANPTGGDRKTFKKPTGETARTYVADDHDVPTRRYAYVEKSVYQMMEFVRALRLTGRYQRLHEEMGEAPGEVSKITSKLRGKLRLDKASTAAQQLAVLHQWMGSGLQQRGLSLASTPRKDAVFGNKGESFKSGDGVRITIDLAKVPKSVKLINHYAYGGVSGFTGEWVGGRAYNYGASVRKNRELYLEKLDPDWVESIEVHGTALPAPPPGTTGAALVKWVGEQIGYQRYLTGYRDALDPPKDASKLAADPAYIVGQNAGKAYADGYAEGAKSSKVADPNARWNRMEDLFLDSDTALQRKEDYWVGWAHGAAGVKRGSHLPPEPVVPVTKPPDPTPTATVVASPVVVTTTPTVVVTGVK
jgi:hypothetical protein